jgi:ABC-type lipoprotein release transport system permease subunit
MIFRLAARNLVRHRWRSSLTAGGIAVAVALLIFLSAWIASITDQMAASATEAGSGHVLVEPAVGDARPALYDSFAMSDEAVAALHALPEVERASPRLVSFALFGDEEQSQVVQLLGLDPRLEGEGSIFARSLAAGRWLSPEPADLAKPREGVIGAGLAQLLGAEIGDELVVFTQAADGSLGNDVVEVVGHVRTGRGDLDRAGLLMHLADAQYLFALEGQAHQIVITTPDLGMVDQAAAQLAATLPEALGVEAVHRAPGPEAEDGVVLQTWREIAPQLAEIIEFATGAWVVIYGFVFALAGVGIVNTQRMSVIERRREFGVVLAVGMAPPLLAGLIVAETVLLVLLGALLGVVLGMVAVLAGGRFGIDPSLFTTYEGELSVLGVAFGEPMYTNFADANFVAPVAAMAALAFVFAIPAAIGAMRLDPVRAISGRT